MLHVNTCTRSPSREDGGGEGGEETEKKGIFLPFIYIYKYILPFVFLGPHPWHMEVPRLGVESEVQLPASTTPQQYQILNPRSAARDRTHNVMKTRWVLPFYSFDGKTEP